MIIQNQNIFFKMLFAMKNNIKTQQSKGKVNFENYLFENIWVISSVLLIISTNKWKKILEIWNNIKILLYARGGKENAF